MAIYRHGDVLLLSVDEIPAGAKELARESVVLAEGEVTGHSHRLSGAGVALLEAGGERYASIPHGGALNHEEHGRIAVAPGDYRAIIQRVYSPTEIRNVAD